MSPRSIGERPFLTFGYRYSSVLGSSDALSFGRGREPRISHHLVNGVSALGNDKLQMKARHALDHNGLGSGAVLVYGITARPGTPTRHQVPVCGNRINLRLVPVAVKRA